MGSAIMASAVILASGILSLAAAGGHDACPGFFGDVDPDTMVITDASTPGWWFAEVLSDASLNISEPMVIVHFMPGIAQSASGTMRAQSPLASSLFVNVTTECMAPGAPITNQCGIYIKTEYKDCTFPMDLILYQGALDKDAEYTVRGSTPETSGIIKGCEDKVVAQTTYCFRRTPDIAFGTPDAGLPPAVDCATCDMPDVKETKGKETEGMTCRDMKKAFKASGCCGNPMGNFTMDRRLSTAVDDDEILIRIETTLQNTKAKKGSKKSAKLAAQMRKIIDPELM